MWLQHWQAQREPTVQTVRNRLNDYLRTKYRRRDAESRWKHPDPSPRPHDEFEETIRQAHLTHRQSLVLHLRYKEDLPWKQIASITELSVSTCKHEHTRALRLIREILS